jgi:hypothetical protein
MTSKPIQTHVESLKSQIGQKESELHVLQSETMYSVVSCIMTRSSSGEANGRSIKDAPWESGEITKWSNSEFISSHTNDLCQSCDDDVDSCDSSPVRSPIHCFRIPASSNAFVPASVNVGSEVC